MPDLSYATCKGKQCEMKASERHKKVFLRNVNNKNKSHAFMVMIMYFFVILKIVFIPFSCYGYTFDATKYLNKKIVFFYIFTNNVLAVFLNILSILYFFSINSRHHGWEPETKFYYLYLNLTSSESIE